MRGRGVALTIDPIYAAEVRDLLGNEKPTSSTPLVTNFDLFPDIREAVRPPGWPYPTTVESAAGGLYPRRNRRIRCRTRR